MVEISESTCISLIHMFTFLTILSLLFSSFELFIEHDYVKSSLLAANSITLFIIRNRISYILNIHRETVDNNGLYESINTSV